MISIIICSRSAALFEKVSASIGTTVGVGYEIVKIDNSNGQFGICKAYNTGAAQAKYPYLCFCHEDILFSTADWGSKVVDYLDRPGVGMVGVVGSVIKTATPSGPWIRNSSLNRLNMVQDDGGDQYKKYENPLNESVSEVAVLDGLWLCCKKADWQQNPFDEVTLSGFHGYDIDFSMQIGRQKKLFVVYNIEIAHSSNGTYSGAWIEAMDAFTNKWRKLLPKTSVPVSRKEIREAEYQALAHLIEIKLQNGYSISSLIGDFVRLFFYKPLNGGFIRLIKMLFTST